MLMHVYMVLEDVTMDLKHWIYFVCLCGLHMHLFMFVGVVHYFITFEKDFAICDVIMAPSFNTLSLPHSGGSMAKMITL
jgi:hypothetical protein